MKKVILTILPGETIRLQTDNDVEIIIQCIEPEKNELSDQLIRDLLEMPDLRSLSPMPTGAPTPVIQPRVTRGGKSASASSARSLLVPTTMTQPNKVSRGKPDIDWTSYEDRLVRNVEILPAKRIRLETSQSHHIPADYSQN